MAAVLLLGTTTWNTTAGNKTVTTTPTNGDLIVVIAAASGTNDANAATTSVSDNATGGTYTLVVQSLAGSSPRISIWIRNALVTGAASTVYTAAQAGSSGGGLAVFRVTGMTKVGGSAARAAATNFNASGTTTPAVTLWTAALTGNALLGGVVNSTSPAGVTPPASWTEDPTPDLGYSTPTTGLETCRRDSGETGTTITWGSTSASAWRAVVVELDTTATGKRLTLSGVG